MQSGVNEGLVDVNNLIKEPTGLCSSWKSYQKKNEKGNEIM